MSNTLNELEDALAILDFLADGVEKQRLDDPSTMRPLLVLSGTLNPNCSLDQAREIVRRKVLLIRAWEEAVKNRAMVKPS